LQSNLGQKLIPPTAGGNFPGFSLEVNPSVPQRRKPMAQRKRESASVNRATERANNLKSIDPLLDLGNGNTLAAYNTKIAAVKTENDTYNTMKSAVDGQLDKVEAMEKQLDTMSVNMLAGVKIKHGADSAEYEMAGGTRASDRKRPVRKPKTPKP